MTRNLIFLLSCLAFLGTGCSATETAISTQNTVNEAATSGRHDPEPVPESEDSHADESSPHPVSLLALMKKTYKGRDFTMGQVLADMPAYTRHFITYKSGDLTISGIANIPKGNGPFPVIILNHGYIDPLIYTNGRGLKREQDYLARQGYFVVHPDYRNHAQSDEDPENDVNFRLG